MFVRASTLVLAIAASVIAAPGGTTPSSQCDTGTLQCCSTTGTAGDSSIGELLGLLGLSLPIDDLVGINCSPIDVLGGGAGAVCTQEPVCCSGNTYNGLINLGCTPINLNS